MSFLKKQWAENNRNKRIAYQKKYKNKNTEKTKAHSVISNALSNGKIQKPEYCSICKKKGKINAHHDDYSKPLKIIWLCIQCHVNIHKEVLCGKAPRNVC